MLYDTFFGIHPTFTHVPPNHLCSIIATFLLNFDDTYLADAVPPDPAPNTI